MDVIKIIRLSCILSWGAFSRKFLVKYFIENKKNKTNGANIQLKRKRRKKIKTKSEISEIENNRKQR